MPTNAARLPLLAVIAVAAAASATAIPFEAWRDRDSGRPDSLREHGAATVAEARHPRHDAKGTPLVCPPADRGDGTVTVLHSALGGTLIGETAAGRLGAPVRAYLLIAPYGHSGVVGTASPSGSPVNAGRCEGESLSRGLPRHRSSRS